MNFKTLDDDLMGEQTWIQYIDLLCVVNGVMMSIELYNIMCSGKESSELCMLLPNKIRTGVISTHIVDWFHSSPLIITRPPRGCSNTRTAYSANSSKSVHNNKHERDHALLRSSASGCTQRGTVRCTMRRGTRLGVTIVFHTVLWNGPIRIVVGRLDTNAHA